MASTAPSNSDGWSSFPAKLFVFGEYKYYVVKYSWDSEGAGNTKIHLDFQTHLVSGGLGWSF